MDNDVDKEHSELLRLWLYSGEVNVSNLKRQIRGLKKEIEALEKYQEAYELQLGDAYNNLQEITKGE